MSTQHANELLEQKHALLEAPEGDIADARAHLDNLPVVRAARESSEWQEIEAYGHLKGNAKMQSLTASTLRGKGKVIIPPVLFYNKSKTEAFAVIHLGKELCGHAGIVHGGLIATLLDEILACVAIPALPYNFGYTANLNIDYRKPLKADQWVVLRGRLDRAEGRKAYVVASIESTDGNTKFSEAKSLYVGPKTPLG
ncbi:HotDog domain-containing protein [Dichotomocladium elegans]|nr:HotDog domain-containing protein [Dichotomocladium elegans]